jgi:hypothetical protein
MKSHLNGLARHVLLAALAVAVPLGALAAAPSAFATPKGAFAVFADCPLTNPEVRACVVAKTESGEFTVGSTTVPLKNSITLQGGFFENEETEELEFVGAADGNTLSKTPQSVPGGLAGLVKCYEISNFFERLACEVIFENGLTGVTATSELAAPASSIKLNEANLVTAKGTALSLPLKIKLDNPLLGASCYIGSNAKPIVVDFTTGTTSPPEPNKPITGNPGTGTTEAEGEILVISNNSLVNNSFAAPKAEGCGGIFSFLIDPLVNAKLGLPSAAGHNTAILNGTLRQASAKAVKAHE